MNTTCKTMKQFIDEMKGVNPNLTFSDLKAELSKSVGENQHYYIKMKEDEDLCIIYYDNLPQDVDPSHSQSATELEFGNRSTIIEKSTLKVVSSQFNRIIYNNDAIEYFKSVEWGRVSVQKCYEGTILVVFNHNNKWYISTRRCLDSSKSNWVKNLSYKDMFYDTIKGKFSMSDLDENYCYHFILLHHMNRNIVNYKNLGKEYKEIVHIGTYEKYTLNQINVNIPNTIPIEDIDVNSVDEMKAKLNSISATDDAVKNITTEGYMIKVYNNKEKTGEFIQFKVQTDLYQRILKIKPNNNNIDQIYLELYQKDLLAEFIPYFTKFGNNIIKRIDNAVKTLAREILDIYHDTRQKKNGELYKALKVAYKKTLYELHGKYMEYRSADVKTGVVSKSISVHDVYHYLKRSDPQHLRNLFYEREKMMQNDIDKSYMIKNEKGERYLKHCMYTKTQSKLMFNFE